MAVVLSARLMVRYADKYDPDLAAAFEKLEDQLCALTPDFDSRAAGFSPDRADALVWAVADLLGFEGGAQGMMDFYAQGGG